MEELYLSKVYGPAEITKIKSLGWPCRLQTDG